MDRKHIASKFKCFLNDVNDHKFIIVKALDKGDVIDWDNIEKLSPTASPLIISTTTFSSLSPSTTGIYNLNCKIDYGKSASRHLEACLTTLCNLDLGGPAQYFCPI